MQRISSESFFGTMKVENPYGESDVVMYPLAKFSSRNLSSATCSLADIGYILQLNVAGASLFSSILWSQDLDGGNFFASSSENKASWRLNSSGSLISSLPCSCAYLCAISVALCVRLISTRPPFVSSGVPPDHGMHVRLTSRMRSSLSFSLIQPLMRWSLPRSRVSICSLGPFSSAFIQSISGLKVLNQGYPRMNLYFPRLVT